MATTRTRTLLLAVAAMAIMLASSAPAFGVMRSERISRNVCLTTGGGRFVDVPGFPGERIDRRLLNDLRYLKRKYNIFLTDGYSTDPVHAANGEHPIGLAADIVPNGSVGGTWRDISRLARRFEPVQDQPIAPFRWVGYNGDSGHGRGDHLHLSWDHSATPAGRPARSVYTLRCPGKRRPSGDSDSTGTGTDPGTGDTDPVNRDDGSSGGVSPTGDGGSTGGISAGRLAAPVLRRALAPVVETGGVGLR